MAKVQTKEYRQKYYQENKERITEKVKAWKKANPDRMKSYLEKNKEKIAERQKKQTAAKMLKLEAIYAEAKDQPCLDCGQKFHVSAMDFDHRPEEIKFRAVSALAKSWRTSLKNLLAEIAKCDLVCSNCHRVRTYNRLMEK